ncbi:alpha/beta hydrolase [Prescottella subtropica]|uniref:alpha/beta hydrolase n=1 Tax=Prescottella subtropica TaxID=2545757 RepID=UPI0010F674ED|nr:alpha/beta hydrolase [Prescottella subtropica]
MRATLDFLTATTLSPLRALTTWAEYARVAASRRPTTFAHPSTVVRTWPAARLRAFSPTGPAVPALVLPPLSGHRSTVVDLTDGCSLIGTALRAGLTGVHCIEWTPSTAPDVGITDLVAVIDDAVAGLGGRAHLISYSQSGWLAAIVAALHPERVAGLTAAAAPIDFTLDAPSHRLAAHCPGPRFHPTALAHGVALRAADSPEECARLADLWTHLGDPARVDAYIALQSWLDAPTGVPAGVYRWTLRHLFARNELVRGTLDVGGRVVDLGAITCPLTLLAGTRDRIVPERQMWALAEHASTPADHVTRYRVDTGHLGMITDPDVLDRVWLPALRRVAASRP